MADSPDSPDRLDKVLLMLGGLEEGQKNAREGRRVIHEKLEGIDETLQTTINTLRDTNFALKVTTDIATQTRDNFNTFKIKFEEEAAPLIEGVSTFQEDAAPVLEQIKKARSAIIVLIAVLGLFGVSTTGIVVFANDYAKAIIREWLEVDVPSSVPPIN